MTTSGESESDDSEMGRLQGISREGPLLSSVSQIKLFKYLAILGDGLVIVTKLVIQALNILYL